MKNFFDTEQKKENLKDFDFEAFKAQPVVGLQAGQTLRGRQGGLTCLIKHFLESALEAKMNLHLKREKAS